MVDCIIVKRLVMSVTLLAILCCATVQYSDANIDSVLNLPPHGDLNTPQFLDGTLDFVVATVPLSDQELQVAKGRILHFPTIVGGDAIIYNLPEVEGPLRLTAPILADIYRGRITEWDDPLIRDANRRVPIPKMHVTPICLSDVSGSTAIFNDYLSKAVSSWRSRTLPLASGNRLACSISASDAQAVARVKQTPGGIGYAEVNFAFNRLSVANILNRTGQAVGPDSETLHAAAVNSSTQIPQDLRMSITDATGRDSYPIAPYSYMVLYERQANRTTGAALIGFLTWVLHDGQNYAAQMHYGTLPAPLVRMEQVQLNQIELPSIEQ